MLRTTVAVRRSGRSIRAESVRGVTELETRTAPDVAAEMACRKVAKHLGADICDEA
jgi:hypothetical protein